MVFVRLALMSLLLSTLVSGSTDADIRFTDISSEAGVSGDLYKSPTGHSLGINWIDFNNDGWADLFLVGGGPEYPPHLFRNNRDGTFARADDLLPELPPVEMSGSIFADYDRDGDQDLFIYTDNEHWRTMSPKNLPDGPPNLLLRNLWMENGRLAPAGQPLFEKVSGEAGLEDLALPPFGELPGFRTKTAVWLDYDRDGCIDLYVGHLVLNGSGTESNRDRFYRNLCNGTFADITNVSGIEPSQYRGALASGGFHLNADLWPDLYVVNVSSMDPQPYPNDFIYLNQGRVNGNVTLTEVTGQMPGIGDDAQAGMGIDVGDPDLDGDWDIYISDLTDTKLDEKPLGNVFYLNNGDGSFADNSAPAAGIEGYDSWGVNFFDADNDGWEDLFVSTISIANRELLYRNEGIDEGGQLRFTNVAKAAGISTGNSRGSAVADYDRDGDLDLALVNQNGSLQLLRNDSTPGGHWIALDLQSTVSNTDAIGAIVEARTGDVVRMRQVKGGSSAHSQDSLIVHFGLGEAVIVDQIRVRWPNGLESILTDVPVNRYIGVVEGALFADGFESGDFSFWSVLINHDDIERRNE